MVKAEYEGKAILTRMGKVTITEHPLTKNAKLFLTIASNPGTQVALGRLGLKSIAELEYAKIELGGENVYKDINKIRTQKGLRTADKLMIMAYEPEKKI